MAQKIKSKDKVIVISGKDKGKVGEVLKVDPTKAIAQINNINVIKKHVKPNNKQNGGIITLNAYMPVSKVMLVCPKCDKATRVGLKIINEKKYRICKKCKEVME
jgi:large subunit ribosomal protein L24